MSGEEKTMTNKAIRDKRDVLREVVKRMEEDYPQITNRAGFRPIFWVLPY
jgi:hypothetical protein